ncbi:MAG TPA: MBL fold metallo-hydrolase [Allosphingosinicella sp.]|nr:MBL fold metallo-hydrolase [Allosphingosinicella sp.]
MVRAAPWQSIGCVSAALALCACAAGDAPPPRAAAVVQAGDPLAAASTALGSARARAAAASIQVEQTGFSRAVEQARSPAELTTDAGRVYRWWFDGARTIREAEQHFPGGIRFFTRAALTPAGGWSVDAAGWRTGTDLDLVAAEPALAARLGWERFLPHLLLAQAEAARATVEPAGEGRFRYRDAAGALIEVTLDPATFRPTRAAQIVDGAETAVVAYYDYLRRHGIMLPARVQIFQGATLREDLRLGATRIGRPADSAFAPPSGYTAPPAPGEPSAREIAPGVLYFENMPADYHSMAVDMGDHLVLVEAPQSPAYAAAQRRILEALRPGKPVRYVLSTHHHGDHNGGLAAWAEAGATIVGGAGARVAIERQLRARGYTGAAAIEEVTGRRSFGDGRIVAYAFPTSHAESHLVAHVPAHRILFQGDLFSLAARGAPPPAFPIVSELRDRIAALGLEVESIVGVHGRIATRAEYEESLRLGGRGR